MTETASVYVQDGGFFVSDSLGESPPFEMMDFSTGLAGVMESTLLMSAGVNRGLVTVSADVADSRPALETPEQWATVADWEDIAEISLYVPHGDLRVDQLEYGPYEPRVNLPVLSPFGPGHYRIRVHARGRDRHRDQVVDHSSAEFHLLTWPQPPAPALIIKATSGTGYGLRLNAVEGPPPAKHRIEHDPEAATHQAMLDRVLRQNRNR